MRYRLPALALLLASGTGAALAQDTKPPLFTAEQAQAGAAVYAQSCASCHGAMLESGAGPALKGSAFAQRAIAQTLTAQALYDVVAFTMPQVDPGSLKPEQYTAVVAFILQQNGYPAGATSFASNAPGMKETRITP